jgi:auxin responsive GH3 family protein
VIFTGNDAKMAPRLTLEALMELNIECRIGFWQGRLRTPTIRLLSKGTFDKYRKRKSDTGISMSHVKVPVVLSDEASKEWFLSKVITEL